MDRNNNRNYSEVQLSENGFDSHYRNPLTKTYQYEYALYLAVSELFASVTCRSGCIESLKLYFAELPAGQDPKQTDPDAGSTTRSKTREGIIREVSFLVNRDVAAKVNFPMMHVCAAEVRTRLEKDGTHTFIFSDGIYGFSVRLDDVHRGHPRKIAVRDINPDRPVPFKSKEDAAPGCAA